MKVEAKRIKGGFLIPMNEIFKNIKYDKITLEVEIVESFHEKDYSPLDQLIGICETKRTDASINHDKIIYEVSKPNDIC